MDLAGPSARRRISFHQNVFAGNNQDQISLRHDTQQVDLVNNVIYGWGWMEGGAGGLTIQHDPGTVNPSVNVVQNVFHHIQGLQGTLDQAILFGRGTSEGQVFFAGNYLPIGETSAASNSERLPTPGYARIATLDASTLHDTVVPQAGTHHPTQAEQDLICQLRRISSATSCGSH